jgi:hypothetical protein
LSAEIDSVPGILIHDSDYPVFFTRMPVSLQEFLFFCQKLNSETLTVTIGGSSTGECIMAEESTEISNVTVIGIGIVLFLVVVGVWYLVIK